MSLEKISVAIPTYRSSKYLGKLLKKLESFSSINEIIISNDFSNQSEEINIQNITNTFKKRNHKKNIVFIKNRKRVGPFVNKYNAINKCSNKIVYQIDSDNLPMINLDWFIEQNLIRTFDNYNIYYPSKIFQFQKYEKLSILGSKFSNKYRVDLSDNRSIFTKEIIKDYIKNDKKLKNQKSIRWLLNVGNFIVHKNNFLESMSEGLDYEEKYLFAADQFMITYLWLKNKNAIELRKNHYHFHRKRSDSVSFSEKDRTDESFKVFENKIIELI